MMKFIDVLTLQVTETRAVEMHYCTFVSEDRIRSFCLYIMNDGGDLRHW